jgi:hypothetical protein
VLQPPIGAQASVSLVLVWFMVPSNKDETGGSTDSTDCTKTEQL